MRTSWHEEMAFVSTVAGTAHVTMPEGSFTSAGVRWTIVETQASTRCPQPGVSPGPRTVLLEISRCPHLVVLPGASSPRNSTALDVPARKPTSPVLADSWRGTCFRFCFCNLFAATTAISEAMYHGQSLPAPGRLASILRANILPTRTPIAGLHSESSTTILSVSRRPVRQRRFAGCGRASSAVPGFEYGLPSPQPRPLGSLAGQSALLPASSLRFFPPIAASVVPLCLKFPGFPFVKTACAHLTR